MQFPKDDIKMNILSAARQEFHDKGFEKASIRNITAAAQTSKSNVYNYFEDKDALFAAVVESTVSGIKTGLEELRTRNPERSAQTYTLEAQKQVIMNITKFVSRHKDDLKLLFFQASGSTLSNFKQEVTVDLAAVLADWARYAAPKQRISDFFVQMVAGFYISVIEQTLAGELAPELTEDHISEFLRFVYGGWKSVLQDESNP